MAASECIIRSHSRVVGKVNKVILKEKLFNHQKVDSQFSRKVIISIRSFPKTTRNSRIAKPFFGL